MPAPGELARAKALIDAGLTGAARMRLEPLVEAHPAWARALGLLGTTYLNERRYQRAVWWFEQTLAADPEELAVRPLHGVALYELGRLEEARAMFASILERRASFAPAHLWLGRIAAELDHTEAARDHFATAIRIAGAGVESTLEAEARMGLAAVLLRHDQLAAARVELELAVALDPDLREAWFRLAHVAARLGDPDAAARASERASAIDPRQPSP
jgi:tetratricopeptide (TPR) repeat protein